MAKGYSARNGFGGSAGMMRQQQQMQQKLAKMQQEMEEKLQFAARLSALRENYSAIAGSLERIPAQAADVPAVRDECRRAMESVRHGLELL